MGLLNMVLENGTPEEAQFSWKVFSVNSVNMTYKFDYTMKKWVLYKIAVEI